MGKIKTMWTFGDVSVMTTYVNRTREVAMELLKLYARKHSSNKELYENCIAVKSNQDAVFRGMTRKTKEMIDRRQ